MGEIVSIVEKKCALDNLDALTCVSTENMLPDYGGVRNNSKLPKSGSFTCFKTGDILFSNIRPYLKKVWKANFDGTASNDVVVFRTSKDFESNFIPVLIKSDSFISYTMLGSKGLKMPRGDKEMMLNYSIAVPPITEQRRIANCLSSIDETINVQTDKLAQFVSHKRGLMQQLFPQA